MADYRSAWIELGGVVSAEVASGLVAAIEQDGAREEWGGEPPTSLDTRGQATLELYDEEARWGEFAAIESFCQAHGIAYDRHADGKYEFDAEVVLYRPGQEPVYRPALNTSGAQVVLRPPVAEALVACKAGNPSRVGELLEQALGPDVPPLTAFSVGADSPEH